MEALKFFQKNENSKALADLTNEYNCPNLNRLVKESKSVPILDVFNNTSQLRFL